MTFTRLGWHTGRGLFVFFFRKIRLYSFKPNLKLDRVFDGLAPEWIKKIPFDSLLAFTLSIVPGLSHYLQKRTKQVRWYCLAWLILIFMSLLFYGSTWGMLTAGLAIGLHTWIALHAGTKFDLYNINQHILTFFILIAFIYGFYYGARSVLMRDFIVGFTSLTIRDPNIQEGDMLMARRSHVTSDRLTRGSMVLVEPYQAYGRRGRNLMMAEIVGLPQETVEIINNHYAINDQPLDPNNYQLLDPNNYPVPLWLQTREFSVIIPRNSYFISLDYENWAEIDENYILNACVFSIERIEARAFMRWNPIRRRGFLREIQ